MSNQVVRCAIYTRKSTNEGSNQEFTSLDTQKESCQSYIDSQKSQGWKTIKQKYDDYGFTGANTDRPGLQKLIEDIKTKQIDCVIVYKVDRLSRSLLDFVKLLELFEKYKVTFVSITQNFNTHSSMGRLTLNILLSFAQFEREIISERTRDKMGASRKKGKWVGGSPGLGYDLDYKNHKLIINDNEAEIIKKIFNVYIEKRSLQKTADTINKQGYRTKRYKRKDTFKGGIEFQITNLQYILKNCLYIGKVNYKGRLYDGHHEAIISEDTFNKVQQILKENNRGYVNSKRKHMGLLTGLIECRYCRCALVYTYSKKNGKKYNYYICSNANKKGYKVCETRLVSAYRLEDDVLDCLRKIYKDTRLTKDVWDGFNLKEKRNILKSIVKTIDYDRKNNVIGITLKSDSKRQEVKINKNDIPLNPFKNQDIKNEPKLRQILVLAHQIQGLLDTGKAKDLKQVAGWMNISKPRVCQVMNFLLLAPSIQEEILFSNEDKIFNTPEYKIYEIMKESDWGKQKETWKEVKNL